MDNASSPLGSDHKAVVRTFTEKGPEYGDSGSSLVNPQNLPSHDHSITTTSTATFSEGGQSNSNGDNSHPCAEGQIPFANGEDIRKTQVAPKAGDPGPM